MTAVTPRFGMGASVRRVADDSFGQGRYTDDGCTGLIKRIDIPAMQDAIMQ